MRIRMSVRHGGLIRPNTSWTNSTLRMDLFGPKELVLSVETAILKALAETKAIS